MYPAQEDLDSSMHCMLSPLIIPGHETGQSLITQEDPDGTMHCKPMPLIIPGHETGRSLLLR
jgi:hypothetical protein